MPVTPVSARLVLLIFFDLRCCLILQAKNRPLCDNMHVFVWIGLRANDEKKKVVKYADKKKRYQAAERMPDTARVGA